MKIYEMPELQVEVFEVEDIITSSGLGGNDLPLD